MSDFLAPMYRKEGWYWDRVDTTEPDWPARVMGGTSEHNGRILLHITGGRVGGHDSRFAWMTPAEARAVAIMLLRAANEEESRGA